MMSGPSFPDHLLTVDEWAALPEYERYRLELCEGVLVVSPHPGYLHQHVTFALVDALAEQLPDELCVLGDVEVLLPGEPPTIRCPDVIVVDRALVEADPDRATAADVRLVVEVTTAGSGRTDRVTKFSEYAESGIPQYWIVDLNAERIEVYRDPLRSRYRSVRLLRPGDTVSPIFAPDLTIEVSTVLGKDRPEA